MLNVHGCALHVVNSHHFRQSDCCTFSKVLLTLRMLPAMADSMRARQKQTSQGCSCERVCKNPGYGAKY